MCIRDSHRGAFLWELADKRKDLSTVQGQLFQMLKRLEQIRRQENVFSQEAEVYTYDVHNDSILGILREYKGERFIALFNFSESEQTAWMQEEGIFRNLVNGEDVYKRQVCMPFHMWQMQQEFCITEQCLRSMAGKFRKPGMNL